MRLDNYLKYSLYISLSLFLLNFLIDPIISLYVFNQPSIDINLLNDSTLNLQSDIPSIIEFI